MRKSVNERYEFEASAAEELDCTEAELAFYTELEGPTDEYFARVAGKEPYRWGD